MGFLWRMTRSWKLQWGVLLVLSVVGILMILPSWHHESAMKSRTVADHNVAGSSRVLHAELQSAPSRTSGAEVTAKKVFLPPRLLGRVEMTSPPAVQKELSLGVKEEENSAREVLDSDTETRDLEHAEPQGNDGVEYAARGDLREPMGEGHAEDANAANEIHSGEPKTQPLGRAEGDLEEEEEALKEQEDMETSFHQLPVHQGDEAFNWRNLSADEINSLSALGRRLFLDERIGLPLPRNFTILVWKTGRLIENRLIKQYGKEKNEPFAQCSVNNCRITYEDAAISTADAVLIHLHRTKGPKDFPVRSNAAQRWIWLSDESPYHTFMVAKDKDLSHYNGYFNWSMSYRMDSDIPVPYGRTVKLAEGAATKDTTVDYFSLKSKTVAIMGSNCGGLNNRWKYVKELQNYLQVDVFGKCGTLKCPGHFTKDCGPLQDYKFYLAFENGDCREYITEKAWWNALGKGSVPVVMGGPSEVYRKILPPNSFLHVDDFASPQDLARYIVRLSRNRNDYNKMHSWRLKYQILNEHGYFQSPVFHYCRICEALNYNDPGAKTYNEMQEFWNKNKQCAAPKWQERMKLSS